MIGITLIPIPYWWNKEISSLKGTIATYRPDVLTTPISNNDIPIPVNQPIKQLNDVNNKIKIESKLMLASNWNIEDDPTGWYINIFIYFQYFLIIFLIFLYFISYFLYFIITYLYIPH